MLELRKGAWVNLGWIYKEGKLEKAARELNEMGIDEAYPLVATGAGAFFPSRIRPQEETFKGKDAVSPFIKATKKYGIRVHPWIVSLRIPNEKFSTENKQLYVVNKNGISCLDSPPYVSGYKWLCPSREEVKENLADTFLEVAERFDVDGVHFDYIRLPDIILPVGLRGKYEGVPKEDLLLPQYDFCYCDVCRSRYREETGIDPMDLKYIEPGYGRWFRWRADRITEVVKNVYRKVKNYDSSVEISAAVFATPKLSYKYVFQDWTAWGLDLCNPMIYHKYYGKPTEWIGEAVREGVLRGIGLSAGILLGFMQDQKDLHNGFKAALDNGALGITIFLYPTKPEMKEWIRQSFHTLEKEYGTGS